MSIELFIAKRYLFTKRKVNLITIISSISIVGVTIGVAAMIIVLSVFNGFNQKVTSILMGFDPHLRIEPLKSDRLENYESILSSLPDNRIKYAAPYTLNKGIVATKTFNKVLMIKGVEEDNVDKVSGLKKTTHLGRFDLYDDGDCGGIVMGVAAAFKLKLDVGDTLTLMSPYGLEHSLTQFVEPATKKFVLTGLFHSENKDYDGKYAYISFKTAQSLFRMKNSASGIEMRLDNINESDEVKADLLKALGDKYDISTWYDLHKDFYSILKIERWVAFIILSLIVAVASFNILASLTMTVIEKKRDIGILKALGATERTIRSVFIFEGIVVGVIGMSVGTTLGLGLVLAQKYLDIYKLDSSVYMINALPVLVRPMDLVLIPLSALLLCVLAALYPATRASKLDPVESIRWE